MKKTFAALAVLAAAALTSNAFAQFAKPEDAIKYRQAAYTLMGKHFHSLGNMATGKAPFDARAAAADAEVLAVVVHLPYTAFGPGTDQGAGTKAAPQIWQKTAEFNKDADDSRAEMAKLVTAARSGSLDALKSAFGPTAKTCKSCHDSFKDSNSK